MRRDRWNTYAEYAYSYSVAQKYDQRSTGGLHLHQVRKGFLFWKERILQANGPYKAAGPEHEISIEEGEKKFAMAKAREAKMTFSPSLRWMPICTVCAI